MTGSTSRRVRLGPWVASMGLLVAAPAWSFDDAAADRALLFARQQLERTANTSGLSTSQYPKSSVDGVTWKLVPNTQTTGWVQGFFPGLLWFMYEPTREPVWRSRADAWTRPLEVQKTNRETHDLGFKFMPSYGNAYRLTGDPYYRDVLLTAAASLASRFNAQAGVIDCCDWNDPPWHVAMVTDTMVNIELLYWAARNGGDPAWNNMALSHALKTASDMVRADGGTFHVVDYDDAGHIDFRGTFQGYSDSSTWSRGQAWAIYGFTLSYRYTRDPRMLQAARKTTEYYLSHLPADSVPNWDFNAPASQQQKDSAAAAAVASALLELSQYVAEPAVAQRYRSAALAMLDSLCSPAYLATASTSPGLLLHGTAFYKTPIKPTGDDIDATLIYGDYYLVEALERFKRLSAGGWYSSVSFPGGTRALGKDNSGVRLVEFDVTPLSKTIDGVIGYAGSATPVTGYASLSLLLRMNPDGYFDVRRGNAYAALTSLPYEALTRYHVRLRMDLGAHTYSVWVQPPGASEVLLADQFPFRSDAPPMNDLGQVTLVGSRFESAFQVQNHTVRAEAPSNESVDPPAPDLEPQPKPEPFPVETGSASSCTAIPGTPLAAAGALSWLAWSCIRRPIASRSSLPAAPTGQTAPR